MSIAKSGLFFHFPAVTSLVFYRFSMLFSLTMIILCDTDQERNQEETVKLNLWKGRI